jgi:hypothetical protein
LTEYPAQGDPYQILSLDFISPIQRTMVLTLLGNPSQKDYTSDENGINIVVGYLDLDEILEKVPTTAPKPVVLGRTKSPEAATAIGASTGVFEPAAQQAKEAQEKLAKELKAAQDRVTLLEASIKNKTAKDPAVAEKSLAEAKRKVESLQAQMTTKQFKHAVNMEPDTPKVGPVN